MTASMTEFRPQAIVPPSVRPRSIIGIVIDKLVALCGIVVPYALVALTLRLVMARLFFLSGQTKITGPAVPINIAIPNFPTIDVSVILPTALKSETLQSFETQYSALPLSPNVAAYLFTYAEFVLPICLLLGFATRFAALALLAMTILIAMDVMPDGFWSTYAYWAGILLVLMSVGPGAISIDALIRYLYEKQ